MASDNQKIVNRLKRAEGQIRGITKMVEDDCCPTQIFTQIRAVKSALLGVESHILESHLGSLEKELSESGLSDARETLKTVHHLMKR